MGLLAIAASAGLIMMSVVSRWDRGTLIESRPRKTLDVSAVQHLGGIDIVSREPEPLLECLVILPGQWRAAVPKLSAMKVETVAWAQFRNASGTVMPDRSGQSARYATITCDSHKESRKGAAVRFR